MKKVFFLDRIEVCTNPEFEDIKGKKIRAQIREDLGISVNAVKTIKAFTINASLSQKELEKIARETFSDPITQIYSVNSALAENFDFDFLLEIAFKPGVTDNEARTALESIENSLGKKINGSIHTSNQFLFSGKISKSDVERIACELLANGLIEMWNVWEFDEWLNSEKKFLEIPEVKLSEKPEVKEFDLEVSDKELEALSERRCLALTAGELRVFRQYFKRPEVLAERKKHGLGPKPTDAELECFAQTQSEHCKHKVFGANIRYKEKEIEHKINGLLKTYIMGATDTVRKKLGKKDFCVSVFHDNAGIIKFDSKHNIAFKVETHNSPSALDPYGGALTGIVGVNRDIIGTGLGAKPIFNTNVLCFGSPFTEKESVPKGVLHPKRIFNGVRKGIEDGGNQIGIPTVNGSVFFDDSFIVRPLVYCGTGGIMPSVVNGRKSHEKRAMPGDKIVMVGGRIGKDGIHGATFSSTKLSENSPTSAVQIGAPIVQKRMQDMLMEARDLGLISSITDNGAGGLSSSVGEMALQSNGAFLQLENAPLKYPGLQPWEILLSEAQERMTLAVPPKKLDKFLELCNKRGVEATVLGEFNDSGIFQVKYGEKTILFLDLEFLHNGLPLLELEAGFFPKEELTEQIGEIDFGKELKEILADLNVCSRHWIVRQYDHEVQGQSVIKPLMGAFNDGPSDAAVIKPLHDSWKGIVVSNGINPCIGVSDSYIMAANAIDEAIRNAVATGANPERIALLDNFCWPDPKFHPENNPKGKEKLGQLVRACRACFDYAIGFCTPFISGKDSLASDREIGGKRYSIKPTLLISALGEIEDVRKAVSIDAKRAGDLVYVLGTTKNELQGSVFLQKQNSDKGIAPRVDASKALSLYKALHRAMVKGIVESCHDCSQGGLIVAIAETAFSGALGMKIDLAKAPREGIERDYQLLFSESASRFVATIKPENRGEFEGILKENDFACIGKVIKEPVLIVKGINGNEILNNDIFELKKAWRRTLDW